MGRHSRRNRFWQMWREMQQAVDEASPETAFDHRRAWRQHVSRFFGVAPEKHWLFRGRRFKPWVSGDWGPPWLFNPFVASMLSRGGGLLSLYLLHLLSEKPRYGNELMREIEERTQGRWGSNPGAVYPLLTDMEARGLVEGEWEDPDKRTRRVYRLTPTGDEELERLKEVMRPKLEEAINVLRQVYQDLEVDAEG